MLGIPDNRGFYLDVSYFMEGCGSVTKSREAFWHVKEFSVENWCPPLWKGSPRETPEQASFLRELPFLGSRPKSYLSGCIMEPRLDP